MSQNLNQLKIKIFADGADKKSIFELAKKPWVKGFTTNPSLMKKAGVLDYQKFAKEILKKIKTKPISFEVFSDDFPKMERQAKLIASWGKNVYIKIPITNTKGKSSFCLIKKLSQEGIKVNVTAVFTLGQIKNILGALSLKTPSIISVFAGRIADTGKDPIPLMKIAKKLLKRYPKTELLWASTRELFNLFEAQKINCDIITIPPEMLNKIDLIGKDPKQLSLEAVKAFYQDAKNFVIK